MHEVTQTKNVDVNDASFVDSGRVSSMTIQLKSKFTAQMALIE